MKKLFFLLMIGAISAGCSAHQPGTTPLPASENRKLGEELLKGPRRAGFELFEPEGNGTVILVSGYRHVLTGSPRPEFVPPFPSETPTLDKGVQIGGEKESVASSLEVKTEELTARANANSRAEEKPLPKSEDPVRRAWSRYCNAGEGLTDDDLLILDKANFEIPEAFLKKCLPPK